MKIENISLAVLAYFENKIMPQIHSSWGKALTYSTLLLAMPEMENSLKKYASGFTNESGDIDFDKLRSVGQAVFEKVPQIEIADFTFDHNDFEDFVNFLSQA